MRKYNNTSILLKVIAYLLLFGCIILFFVGLSHTDNNTAKIYIKLYFIYAAGCFVAFAFVRGFAEIIQLLEDIKGNTVISESAKNIIADTNTAGSAAAAKAENRDEIEPTDPSVEGTENERTITDSESATSSDEETPEKPVYRNNYCPGCGRRIPAGNSFCTNCGTRVSPSD